MLLESATRPFVWRTSVDWGARRAVPALVACLVVSYQVSQWTIVSSGARGAGVKRVPLV